MLRAYNATIEGWSRSLDLRDKETEGHTRRVTETTLELARAMGIPEADLVHVRRGALPHDIGKLGVPDQILLEPAPLSDAEWEVMRRHPEYDVWDALRSDRPYRPALSEQEALDYLRASAGSHFDPAVVEAFLALLERRGPAAAGDLDALVSRRGTGSGVAA